MDYFVFPRGLLTRLPDFAIGRAYWDTWLVFHARARKIPVLDATAAVMAIHQDHEYGHVLGGQAAVWKGHEARRNRELAEEMLFPFTLEDATFELTGAGVQRPRRTFGYARRQFQAELAIRMRGSPRGRRALRLILRARFV